MICSDLMKNNVECLKTTDTVQVAARRMREKNIGFIPVCDDAKKIVGTVTDRDLALRILADAKASNTTLQDVMSKDVVTCRPDDDLKQAQRLMEEKQKSRIVCTDGAGRAVGVISLSDIASEVDAAAAIRTMRRVSEREARA